MARRAKVTSDLFKKTDGARREAPGVRREVRDELPETPPVTSRTSPVHAARGRPRSDNPFVTIPVSLPQSEKQLIADVAAELGIRPNNLCRYAILHLVRQYRQGRLDLSSAVTANTTRKLPIPEA